MNPLAFSVIDSGFSNILLSKKYVMSLPAPGKNAESLFNRICSPFTTVSKYTSHKPDTFIVLLDGMFAFKTIPAGDNTASFK